MCFNAQLLRPQVLSHIQSGYSLNSVLSSKYCHFWLIKNQDGDLRNAKLDSSQRWSKSQWIHSHVATLSNFIAVGRTDSPACWYPLLNRRLEQYLSNHCNNIVTGCNKHGSSASSCLAQVRIRCKRSRTPVE